MVHHVFSAFLPLFPTIRPLKPLLQLQNYTFTPPRVQIVIQACHLSVIEAQSVFVYTASHSFFVCPFLGALFASCNRALRHAAADSVHAWSGYSFLLVNALLKLPSAAFDPAPRARLPL
jgi:hypothetical protein